jgi:hypothetical protein
MRRSTTAALSERGYNSLASRLLYPFFEKLFVAPKRLSNQKI